MYKVYPDEILPGYWYILNEDNGLIIRSGIRSEQDASAESHRLNFEQVKGNLNAAQMSSKTLIGDTINVMCRCANDLGSIGHEAAAMCVDEQLAYVETTEMIVMYDCKCS
jgi:hypothetical protein